MPSSRPALYRNVILLLQGQFVSQAGSQIYDIAMLLWLHRQTGSAALMGAAMLLSNLPEAVLAPLGGAIADRLGRMRTMISADLASGLIVGAVTLVLVLPVPLGVRVLAMCAGNVLLGLAAACFVPASSSLLPALVPQSRLDRANAAQQMCSSGARLLGQAAGGILFVALDVEWAFAINAASFFVAAISESFIRLPAGSAPPTIRTSVFSDMLVSLRHLWRTEDLRRPLVGIAVFHFCFASLPVLLPFALQARLGRDASWLGILIGCDTAGVMVGFVLAGVLASRGGSRARRIGVAAAVAGLLFILLALSRSVLLALPALAGIGIAVGVIIVNLMTTLQLRAPEQRRAVTMGAAHAVGSSSLPIGMAIIGILFDLLCRAGATVSAATLGLLALCGAFALLSTAYMTRGAASKPPIASGRPAGLAACDSTSE